MGSVWKGRSREWIVLPTCGASRGIVIMWDSNKLKYIEKVLGSFFIIVKLNSSEEGSVWLTLVYGHINLCGERIFGWSYKTCMV